MVTTVGSGLGQSLGSVIESSYGTSPAGGISLWTAVESFEVEQAPVFVDGSGLRGGTLVKDVNDHVLTNLDASGPMKMPVYYKGLGRYIASLMGSLGAAGAPVQIGGTTAYQQTHAFASQWGQSLTFQQAVPWVSGLVQNWMVLGSKVTEGQFECAAGQALMATFTVDAQDRFESPATIATPTEPINNPFFAWHNMVVKIGALGAEAKVDGVSKWTAALKRAKADKRFNAGNVTVNPNPPVTGAYGVKDEPVDNGFAALTGTLETEYLSDLFIGYYTSQTPFSLIVSFTSNVLAGAGNPYSIVFAFPSVRFIKGDPKVPGPDIVKPSLPFELFNDETHNPATITIVSSETSL